MAKANDGAPGIDGVTFDSIEGSGVERFLLHIRDELITSTYQPMRARKKEIPKDGGKVRLLWIPTIRDRVSQYCCEPAAPRDMGLGRRLTTT
jgi:RNA-directed DNA polymerase